MRQGFNVHGTCGTSKPGGSCRLGQGDELAGKSGKIFFFFFAIIQGIVCLAKGGAIMFILLNRDLLST